jgi:2'-5' RNA ligase
VLAAAIEECDALQSLAGRVEAGCVDLGVAPERRRFHGHVTLARLRGQRISPESLEQIDLQTARLRPAAVRLMQSLLGPAGSTYVPLVSRFW